MLGVMRLVNPWRGLVYFAQVEGQYGMLSARTGDFKHFSIYSVQSGKEFYPGRIFERAELAQWLLGEPLHPDQRALLADEFGDIPAVAPNPQSWVWLTVSGQGEERLKRAFKPNPAELQQLAGAALSLQRGQFYPLLDSWEIWLCDKDTLEPLALAITALTLEDTDWQTFSPRWHANWQSAPAEHKVGLHNLEKEINARINSATDLSCFRSVHRLFQRNLDGSSQEWARENPVDVSLPLLKVADHPAGYLPDGLLAEPFESQRLQLEPRA
jgi:hypothetical protein